MNLIINRMLENTSATTSTAHLTANDEFQNLTAYKNRLISIPILAANDRSAAMLLTLAETLIALILALYALASLPTDFLRRLSSPLLVFAFLNASLLLLSLRRISPHASIPPPIAAEFQIRPDQPTADDAIVADVAAEVEDRVDQNSVDGEEILIEEAAKEDDVATPAEEEADVVTAAEESDEEVVEELSTAEFNRIIEAFLEKQKRFHYQENLSILV